MNELAELLRISKPALPFLGGVVVTAIAVVMLTRASRGLTLIDMPVLLFALVGVQAAEWTGGWSLAVCAAATAAVVAERRLRMRRIAVR